MLVFDGECPFCRHFAELSELRGGIPGLRIRDGRAETALRQDLARRGFHLRDGAMVIDGVRVWHGAEAIQWICARMTPSAALLQVLSPLLADGGRARRRAVERGRRELHGRPSGAVAGRVLRHRRRVQIH